MGCPEKDCCANNLGNDVISFPGTHGHDTPWKFYNHLIRHVPEDLVVRDYCLGTHWSYVEADCGMGISFTCKGGAKRKHTMDLRGLPLRAVAELAKSWCFEEATLGEMCIRDSLEHAEMVDAEALGDDSHHEGDDDLYPARCEELGAFLCFCHRSSSL